MMIERTNIINGALTVSLFVTVSFVVLWFMAPGTSPALPQAMYDVGIFRTIGQCWAQGGLPYVDLFDQKGPLLYLIYALVAVIGPSKWWIFIVECLTLTLSASIFYKVGTTLGCSRSNSRLASVVMILAAVILCEMGGTVEEFSLPFELLPLWLVSRFLTGKSSALNVCSFVTGLCFGCVALIRINNNAVITGICIVMAIWLIRYRYYMKLVYSISLFVAGLIVAILPFIVYFACHGALSAMFYSVYYVGWLYKTGWGAGGFMPNPLFIIIYLIYLISLTASCVFAGDRNSRFVLYIVLAGCLVNILINLGSTSYTHYLVMFASFMAFMWLYFDWKRWCIYLVFVILSACFLYITRGNMVCRVRSAVYTDHNVDPVVGNFAIIPPEERNSIYVCGTIDLADIPLSLGTLPAGKYFFQQNMYGQLDEGLYNDIIDDFITTDPLWVIAEYEDSDGSLSMLKPYMADYELVTVNDELFNPYRTRMAVYRKKRPHDWVVRPDMTERK